MDKRLLASDSSPDDKGRRRGRPHRTSGRGTNRRGLIVLAAGAFSTLALAWAALVVTGDADAAGRLAATRLAGDVSDAAIDELHRWRRSWQLAGENFDADALLSWSASAIHDPAQPSPRLSLESDRSTPAQPTSPASEWPGLIGNSPTACDMLLIESQRAEQQGGRDEDALALALDALAVAGDRRREGEAQLRSLQLAVRLNRKDLVIARWTAVRDHLDPAPTRNGTSCLLLCALSAAPFLDTNERQGAWQQLAALWLGGELRLAGAPTSLRAEGSRLRLVESPLHRRWRERLTDLAAQTAGGQQEVGAFVALDNAHLKEQAALSLLSNAPVGSHSSKTDDPDDLGLALVDGGWLAYRVGTHGGGQGLLMTDTQMRQELHEHLDRSGVLPDGFVVGLSGGEPPPGTLLRPELSVFPGSGLGLTLYHVDHGALVESFTWERRASGLGLALAAAFSAVAALATWRTLRRQDRLDQLKSAFVASVSHELRTPVASIQLMAENLDEQRVTDDAGRKRYYGSMRRESLRLGRLVNDVLDFSRLERGEPARLRREPVEVASFLDALCSEVSDHGQRSGRAIAIDRQELSGVITLDHDAICRVVLNLVENALVHGAPESAEGEHRDGPELHIASLDRTMVLSVRDHGPGVPEGRRQQIFEPFARGGEATAGMGLGLSIVAAIVDGHGGTITVGSPATGHGALFTVTLPLDDAAPHDATGD